MYSEKDMAEINAKLRKNWLVLTPVLAAILAVYVYALAAGVKWLAMVAGPLLFVAACYGILAYLLPNGRYRGFLLDMEHGLSRDVRGTIVEVSDVAQPQDGAMVLPVRVLLDADAVEAQPSKLAARVRDGEPAESDNERIVYLNASKREGFPGPGTAVTLHCYGRHVKRVEVESGARAPK